MKYITYDESLHGNLIYPEGFADLLEGLSIEEQMDYFRIGNGVYLRRDISKRKKEEYSAQCWAGMCSARYPSSQRASSQRAG